MTLWNPVWKVTIGGVEYTDYVLANLTATSGRTNIYDQAQAGYCNLSLYNVTQSAVNIDINDAVAIELKDSTGAFVPIFGGSVVDVTIGVTSAGSILVNQTIEILALGALSRLQKALTNGVLSKAFDGTQIKAVLSDLLYNTWSEVPAALTWATYTPATTTWANAENTGLGTIDTPGEYELAARSSSRTDAYSLVAALATSGLGYIYEDAQGRISYADASHRTSYLAANGYIELDAAQAIASGLRITYRAGDVRNSITVKYGATSSSEQSATDPTSIATYGQLAQIITTTLHNSADATAQANFYLALRANPYPMLTSITFELASPELDDTDRDALINIFMGLPLRIYNLPANMAAGAYQGFVEGWQISAGYNQISVTALLSPLSYSLQAQSWDEVSVSEAWNTISGTLEWQNAIIVA
jgi:hypothetical protein